MSWRRGACCAWCIEGRERSPTRRGHFCRRCASWRERKGRRFITRWKRPRVQRPGSSVQGEGRRGKGNNEQETGTEEVHPGPVSFGSASNAEDHLRPLIVRDT